MFLKKLINLLLAHQHYQTILNENFKKRAEILNLYLKQY